MQCVTDSAARHAVSFLGDGLMPSGAKAANSGKQVSDIMQFYNQSAHSKNNNFAA